jgi:hypothetical protein
MSVYRKVRCSAPRWSVAADCLVIAMLAVGCLSCTSTSGKLDAAPVSSERLRSGLPIEAVLLLSDVDQASVESSLRRDVDSCMKDRGFEYHTPITPVAESVFSTKSRYGSLKSLDVSSLGYRDPTAIALANLMNSQDQQPMSQAEIDALVGKPISIANGQTTPDGSDCYSQARIKIYGNLAGMSGWPGYEAVVNLQIQSIDELYASQEGIAAMTDWSDCMTQAGYTFKNWWEAPASLGIDSSSSKGVTESERRLATRDAHCRDATHFEDRLLSAESKIQDRLLAENQALVAEFLEAAHKINAS